MSPLVLTREQEELVKNAPSSVPVHDSHGRIIGVLIPEVFEPERFVEVDQETLEVLAERMSMKDIEWYTMDEVRERLRLLDEQLGAQ